jgi:hypothetical protein
LAAGAVQKALRQDDFVEAGIPAQLKKKAQSNIWKAGLRGVGARMVAWIGRVCPFGMLLIEE